MPRIRTRLAPSFSVMNGVQNYSSEIIEYMLDYVGPRKSRHNPCLHLKYLSRASGQYQSLYYSGFSDHQVGLKIVSRLEGELQSLTAPPPKFIKNNKFDLLPTLVELDDTLSMFSLKFIKNFSYGSFTWGIMPFLSDVRALADSYKDVLLGFDYHSTSQLDCEGSFPLKWEGEIEMVNSEVLYGGFDGTAAIRATATTALDEAKYKLNKLYFLLDEFGVNPDASAVWESLPLSFVVDYFVNIGDVLESLHPRGWVDWNWQATGFTSFKGSFRHLVRYQNFALPAEATGSLYIRTPLRSVEVIQRPVEVEWKTPTLHQWFNVAYLFSALRRIF